MNKIAETVDEDVKNKYLKKNKFFILFKLNL